MSEEYILEVRNLTKTFPGVRALDNVNLKLRPGTVHAVLGENGAGKSTLMNCIIGLLVPDSGEIIYDGKEVRFSNSLEAIKSGISMIHQEMNPILERSVAENVYLGRLPLKNGVMVDHAEMHRGCLEIFERISLELDPDTPMKNLSVAHMQMVEIAKTLLSEAKVIIMDEPTSALTESEVEELFRLTRQLRNEGVAILYITHKLGEVFEITDDITIFRDGKFVTTGHTKDFTQDSVITQMVGRELKDMYPEKRDTAGDVFLTAENLNSSTRVKDVSFEVRKGEILGFAGLVGAGRTETMESIIGKRKTDSGKVLLNGQEVTINSPEDALLNGIVMLTEDRRDEGIVGIADIQENITLANLRAYGFPLNNKQMYNDASEYMEQLRIKAPNLETLVMNLSGGNQQKTLVARALLTDPEVLIIDEPTKGIDVGAKTEIYNILREIADQGTAVIMVSSEMPEIIGMSNRVIVMHEGKIVGELVGEEITEENIMTYQSGITQ